MTLVGKGLQYGNFGIALQPGSFSDVQSRNLFALAEKHSSTEVGFYAIVSFFIEYSFPHFLH
jgi:hypothetical protein